MCTESSSSSFAKYKSKFPRRKASARHKKERKTLFKTMQELHKRKMDKVSLFIVWICSMILNINKFTEDHRPLSWRFPSKYSAKQSTKTWINLLDSQMTHPKQATFIWLPMHITELCSIFWYLPNINAGKFARFDFNYCWYLNSNFKHLKYSDFIW